MLPVTDLTTLTNEKRSTAQLTYPLILSVFTTWCTICKKELPQLSILLRDARSKNIPLTIVGVDAGEMANKVLSFQRRQHLGFELVIDSNLDLVKKLQIKGTPVILVFNKAGKLTFQGNRVPPQWQSLIQ